MKPTVVKYMLMAQDMKRAIKFYTEAIELELSFESEYWSELRFGDSIIALHGGGDGSLNKTGLSFQFEDVKSVFDQTLKNGAREVQKPTQNEYEPIILSVVIDPEGNEIMMTQYVG